VSAPIQYNVILSGNNISATLRDTLDSTYTFYNLPAVDSNIFARVEAQNIFGTGGFSAPVASDTGISKLIVQFSHNKC